MLTDITVDGIFTTLLYGDHLAKGGPKPIKWLFRSIGRVAEGRLYRG